ncbi:MAG: bifunctional heptose 7-phosphate kinase/heptose 1-phosphate adenyltransferase [Parachlamydiaceae bacterium]
MVEHTSLIGQFSQLTPKKILVAGDLMLDTYTVGKAQRISPEAPVVVVRVENEHALPGGAGNALLNLKALGAEPWILGKIGRDDAGKTLKKLLSDGGISTETILDSAQSKTPVKNRIVSDNQQIVRIDHETITPLSDEEERSLIAQIPKLLDQVDLVTISDYAKGFLTPNILQALIRESNQRKLFTIADPKGIDFSKYNGVTLLKPNQSEAYAAAKASPSTPIDEVAKTLLQNYQIEYLMITRSKDGIALFDRKGNRQDFTVKAKQVKDVTGAGDTVLATLAFCVANNLPLSTAIQFANMAAGIAIEQFGCAQVSLIDLAKRLFDLDSRNKVFDLEHLPALQFALKDTACFIHSFSGSSLPSPELISQLIERKKTSDQPVLAVIESTPIHPEIVTALSALHPIDYVLLNTSLAHCKKAFASSES